MTTETQAKSGGLGSWIFAIVIIAVAGFIILRPTKPAPVPPFFASGATSLDSAISRADAEGKLVYAFATADWCGPCQTFKKGALIDPRVADWIEANAVPVYIDVDKSPGDAQRLNVRPIPASIMLRDGSEVSRIEGVESADTFLAWLEQSARSAG